MNMIINGIKYRKMETGEKIIRRDKYKSSSGQLCDCDSFEGLVIQPNAATEFYRICENE